VKHLDAAIAFSQLEVDNLLTYFWKFAEFIRPYTNTYSEFIKLLLRVSRETPSFEINKLFLRVSRETPGMF